MGGSAAERRRAGAPVDAYLAELARRARSVLGERLVGVYAGGSLALHAYEQGRSDLDVAVVVAGRLGLEAKQELAAALRDESLPCPARGLELVVYSGAAAASPGVEVDRAILHDHAIPVVGPPPGEVFAAIPRSALLPVVAEDARAGGEPVDGETAAAVVATALRDLRAS